MDNNIKWEWIKAKDFIDFNPKEVMQKGIISKKIAMDKLEPHSKEIIGYDNEPFNGGTKFKNGDTLMARITPCLENGKIAYVDFLDDDELAFGSTEFIVLREKENISDKNFIYYLAISDFFKKPAEKSMVGSSGRQRVQTNVLKELEIKVPDLNTQKKISSILSYFDNLIKLNKKINHNLDLILDNLFKKMFIDKFSENTIPDKWNIKKIGDLPLIITDYVANGSFASLKNNVTILNYEDYAYFIRNTDLKTNSFEKFVDEHSYKFLKKSSLFGNEVLISNVGDVGSIFLCPSLDKPMTLGNNMILVKSEKNNINLNYYIYLLFKSSFGQYLLNSITSGSVQLKFNKTDFKSLKLTFPTYEYIDKFNRIIQPIFKQKNILTVEINKLTILRDTLLPKLMSGKLNLSKMEL